MKEPFMQKARPKDSKSLNENIDNEYLNINKVSEMLDLSVSHIYTLTSQKKIPHIKLLGKKILFSKVELERWISTKTIDHQ